MGGGGAVNRAGALSRGNMVRQKDNEVNQHQEQFNSVPLIEFDPSVHRTHLEPCYKKFSKIISVARKRNADEAEAPG